MNFPQLFPCFEIVGYNPGPAVNDDLSGIGIFVNQGCSPTAFGNIFTRDSPEFFAVRKTKRDEERVGRVVASENDVVFMNGRGAGITPTDTIFTDIDDTEVLAPFKVSIEVVTLKSF
jgi:hypothetical protein